MKTTFRYLLLSIICAGFSSVVYEAASVFIPEGWSRMFLFICIMGASSISMLRWVIALVNDPRDPLDIHALFAPEP